MDIRISPHRTTDSAWFYAGLAVLSLIVFTNALTYFSTAHHQDIDCHAPTGVIYFARRDVSVQRVSTGWRVLGSDSGYVPDPCYVRPTKKGNQ